MKNGLPIDYVKTFTAAQMRMHGLSRSYEWKELKMTPEKIAELNLPSDFDQYKLKEVLHYLSATKNEPWERVVGIINGEDNAPTTDYISKVLYSRIYRDKAKEALGLPAELLGDECTWFNHEADIKALTVFIRDRGLTPVASIAELSVLNKRQKWVIVVGGDISEARQMYVSAPARAIAVADSSVIVINADDIPSFRPERDAQRDLQKFRQTRADIERRAALLATVPEPTSPGLWGTIERARAAAQLRALANDPREQYELQQRGLASCEPRERGSAQPRLFNETSVPTATADQNSNSSLQERPKSPGK